MPASGWRGRRGENRPAGAADRPALLARDSIEGGFDAQLARIEAEAGMRQQLWSGISTPAPVHRSLPLAFGGGGQYFRVTESTIAALCVILAWLIGWPALGAWRMMTRDA
ncbi:MAG TPA: hypothetical protein VMB79_01055 [Jatrophihabitans sp.]|nr:hypothetical protein [Jatrophihabitans sp.]